MTPIFSNDNHLLFDKKRSDRLLELSYNIDLATSYKEVKRGFLDAGGSSSTLEKTALLCLVGSGNTAGSPICMSFSAVEVLSLYGLLQNQPGFIKNFFKSCFLLNRAYKSTICMQDNRACPAAFKASYGSSLCKKSRKSNKALLTVPDCFVFLKEQVLANQRFAYGSYKSTYKSKICTCKTSTHHMQDLQSIAKTRGRWRSFVYHQGLTAQRFVTSFVSRFPKTTIWGFAFGSSALLLSITGVLQTQERRWFWRNRLPGLSYGSYRASPCKDSSLCSFENIALKHLALTGSKTLVKQIDRYKNVWYLSFSESWNSRLLHNYTAVFQNKGLSHNPWHKMHAHGSLADLYQLGADSIPSKMSCSVLTKRRGPHDRLKSLFYGWSNLWLDTREAPPETDSFYEDLIDTDRFSFLQGSTAQSSRDRLLCGRTDSGWIATKKLSRYFLQERNSISNRLMSGYSLPNGLSIKVPPALPFYEYKIQRWVMSRGLTAYNYKYKSSICKKICKRFVRSWPAPQPLPYRQLSLNGLGEVQPLFCQVNADLPTPYRSRFKKALFADYGDYLSWPKDSPAAIAITPSIEEEEATPAEEIPQSRDDDKKREVTRAEWLEQVREAEHLVEKRKELEKLAYPNREALFSKRFAPRPGMVKSLFVSDRKPSFFGNTALFPKRLVAQDQKLIASQIEQERLGGAGMPCPRATRQNLTHAPNRRLRAPAPSAQHDHRWWQKRRVAVSLLGAPSKRYLAMPEISPQDWKKIVSWQLKNYLLEEERRVKPLVLEAEGAAYGPARAFKIRKIAVYLPWTTLKKSLEKPFSWPLTRLSYRADRLRTKGAQRPCYVSSISPAFKASALSSTLSHTPTVYKPFLFEAVTDASYMALHQLLLAVATKGFFGWLYSLFGKVITDKIKSSSLANVLNATSRTAEISVFSDLKKRLKDLRGSEDTVSSLSEIVWHLRNSCRGRMTPRGVVLVETVSSEGTDYVKAVGGEAQVPVIVQSLRALPFTQNHPQRRLEKILMFAQKRAPCILFLDDLDSIGQSRLNKAELCKGRAEQSFARRRVDLMLRLLTVMDGITQLAGVLVVTTSKDPAGLDPALLRPGRFEKLINLGLPNKKRRISLLKAETARIGHLRHMPWSYLGTETRDMTGTEIASAVNHSALRAIIQHTPHTLSTLEHGIACVMNREGGVSGSCFANLRFAKPSKAASGVTVGLGDLPFTKLSSPLPLQCFACDDLRSKSRMRISDLHKTLPDVLPHNVLYGRRELASYRAGTEVVSSTMADESSLRLYGGQASLSLTNRTPSNLFYKEMVQASALLRLPPPCNALHVITRDLTALRAGGTRHPLPPSYYNMVLGGFYAAAQSCSEARELVDLLADHLIRFKVVRLHEVKRMGFFYF